MNFTRIALATGLLAVACAAGAQTAPRKVYIVQLADPPAATYTGTISGLPATRSATGARFDARTPAVRAYLRHLEAQRNATLAAAGNPRVIHNYGIAFNGYSALMTANQAKTLMTTAGVKSVSLSEVRKPDTTTTPDFLGLRTPGGLWSQLDGGGTQVRGENVIIGVIDSGVWPENASFGDKVDAGGAPVAYNSPGTLAYTAPPAKWAGTCQTGAGFTNAMCGNKLIGARYYVDAFKASGALLIPLEYESPRDGGGHGTHTASTSGGNAGVAAAVNGAPISPISGVAPRARVAVYKVCWEATVPAATGCYTADTLKAIDDAVKDGVDVINYSVSGTQTNFLDAVEIAYLNATAAGVFVAASAGNSGPGNQVAHMSPWITTVANSTHDRAAVAELVLGNGNVYSGASVFGGTLPSAPMVLSKTIPGPGQTEANANLCFLGSLDTTAAIGKIVVCDRGTNARVDKSAEAKRVGGVGMVLLNTSSGQSLNADFHSVPTVHLASASRAAVQAYAITPGATGSIRPPAVPPVVVAPVMNSSSSRGPNKANANILKPDITGPGTDILAGYIAALTQPQHDDLVAGIFTPPPNANSLTGTSMSSPHVAGAAALLRQLYPTWSPGAVKSAMMSSATQTVKLADGSPDPDRWGYGAGHMNPNGSANPGLVYDVSPADYGRFLCGLALTPPAGLGTCDVLGSILPYNLNLASLTAADVPGTLTMTRKVTNVTGASATFNATASLPGWGVEVTPSTLNLAAGASGTFNVKVTNTGGSVGVWSFGSLAWSDGVRTVTSPLSARGLGFVAPAQVTDVRASGKGSKVFNIVSAYTGTLQVVPNGLVEATRSVGFVPSKARQCFNFSVAAGAELARFQLFNADTDATDLDLDVFNGPDGTGTNVGTSGGAQSEETVTLTAPSAGTYSACVTGYSTPPAGANFTLSSWIVGLPVATTLKATGPANVYAGGSASIGLSWNVPAGKRYLGTVKFMNGATQVGVTTAFIDNH